MKIKSINKRNITWKLNDKKIKIRIVIAQKCELKTYINVVFTLVTRNHKKYDI